MTLNDYWREVNRAKQLNPEWRYGQTAYNVLRDNFPELIDEIRNTDADPFNIRDSTDMYTHPVWVRFTEYVNSAIPDYRKELS